MQAKHRSHSEWPCGKLVSQETRLNHLLSIYRCLVGLVHNLWLFFWLGCLLCVASGC